MEIIRRSKDRQTISVPNSSWIIRVLEEDIGKMILEGEHGSSITYTLQPDGNLTAPTKINGFPLEFYPASRESQIYFNIRKEIIDRNNNSITIEYVDSRDRSTTLLTYDL